MNKEPDVQEIQMAILIATAKNGINHKSKAKPDDFILTKKMQKDRLKNRAKKEDGLLKIGNYNPIKESDLSKYLKTPSK